MVNKIYHIQYIWLL